MRMLFLFFNRDLMLSNNSEWLTISSAEITLSDKAYQRNVFTTNKAQDINLKKPDIFGKISKYVTEKRVKRKIDRLSCNARL